MYSRLFMAVLGLVIVLSLIACGEKESQPNAITTTELFPDKLTGIEISRTTEPVLFVGDSLYEYINGGAEIYHQYDFVEVATATYTFNQVEIIVDIYRFTNSDGAYGLYSFLRPEQEDYLSLGIQGFGSESSRDFVKGEYMVRVIGYDSSDDTKTAVDALAASFAQSIPGTDKKPSMYTNLPAEMIISGTDKYIIESFMGHTFLTQVYSQNYDLNGEILQLFISTNPVEKFTNWREAIQTLGTEISTDEKINLPENNSFVYQDGFYGNIVVGTAGDYLIGAIDYKPEQIEFINTWLSSLNK